MPVANALRLTRLIVAILLVGTSAASLRAQSGTPTAALAEGWAALGAGDLAKAAKAADRAMAESARNAAAVALAVEVEIAKGGQLAGLDAYERWLSGRRVDDAYALRRIAHAYLSAVVKARKEPGRAEALKALAADGDQNAVTELGNAALAGSAETAAAASLGDGRAIDALIASVQGTMPGKVRAIEALADTNSPRAIAPLVSLLTDPREETRAAAAEGLGKLGARDAVPHIKPLLNDPVPPVRFAAAGALYRLQDYSGVNMLEGLLNSEYATARLSAAELMSGTPTPTWQSTVKALLNEPDERVQLGAASLIAPFDPQAATATLERLGQSQNMTIREEAAKSYLRRLAADFASLRRYLRNPDVVIAGRAAARILELTR